MKTSESLLMAPKVNQGFHVAASSVSRSHLALEKEDNHHHQPNVPTADLQGGGTPREPASTWH